MSAVTDITAAQWFLAVLHRHVVLGERCLALIDTLDPANDEEPL